LSSFRRKEIDHDNVEGPYGSRGTKKLAGEPITPMLVDSEVYKSFLVTFLHKGLIVTVFGAMFI
jgi:hypothetical protein